ncbi:hypothetical protein Glove_242g21 [Diversispora epigaea]|uniref:BTB domain-containing protein n=1 Tax=Diversispora epigaea TaxID=1348612 RepID=A0A397IDU6_9GLOM|nr:hypothetical protein Glove_242g21 [Diversispora epigaea]
MELKFFDKLSQNYTKLLNDKVEYNVIIEVEDKKQFTAHSNILKCRSPYFCKELDTINPNENNVKTIIKQDISAQIFDIILKYIYGGIVNLKNIESRIIFDLMLAANKFELEELSKKLETTLIEDKASWLKSHFSLVYRTIFINNNFKDLEKFCNDIVAKHPSLIFDAEDFTSLQESALVSLLKRDDLQIEEVKIWEYIIKWGIAQNPTLPVNLDEWNKDNFLKLKTTLQHCLPYIRYFHISGDDVSKKVKPYKKILDKQLWEDLIQHFMSANQPKKSVILPARTILIPELPARSKEPFSTIISDDHAAEISSWIDRKNTTYPSTNYPYEFQLILRGSKDGFVPQTFWDMCHGHAGTVVIIKVKGTDEIIGGYNPLMWDNNTGGVYKETNDNFTSLQESALVSLLKRDDLQIEEVKIWEYIIKWGIAQNPTLPVNLDEWNKDNFLKLKTTLQHCLPYIRYFHISGDDVSKKVKPYKKILDKQLWEDLIQHFMSANQPKKSVILPARTILIPELPARSKEPFSTIISDDHAAEISSWIDRKNTTYPSTNYPYEFQLILRGSKDGFVPQTFWDMCHGHAGTVVIIKVKGTDEIIGGYNPLAWDNSVTSNVFRETNDSFIFSLKNGNIQNSILSRVKLPKNSLYYWAKGNQKNQGPLFGGGNNLYMRSDQSNFTIDNLSYSGNDSNYYEKPIRTGGHFSIIDYEVFEVNRKTN